jgi:hypothetical protein
MKVLLVLLLVLAISEAAAQSPIASLDKGRIRPIQKGDRSFTIEPSYVLKDYYFERALLLIQKWSQSQR